MKRNSMSPEEADDHITEHGTGVSRMDLADRDEADAMKQAPTPGPLSGFQKGDVVRQLDWNAITTVDDVSGQGAHVGVSLDGKYGVWPAARFSFIGRPDADGWIAWSGGANPVPGCMLEMKTADGWVSDPFIPDATDWAEGIQDDHHEWREWAFFRFAPTAPVEASGSERESDLCKVEKAITAQPGVKLALAHGTINVRQIARAVLAALRPQPSGETREGEVRAALQSLLHYCNHGAGNTRLLKKAMDRAETALRPAPVASGGQHSSGEDVVQWFKPSERTPESGMKFVALHEDGSGAWLGFMHDGGILDADGEDYSTTLKGVDCWAYLPTGYEFCCEGYPEEALALPDHVCPPLSTIPAPVAETAGEALWFEKGFTSPNVPAQDDDKLDAERFRALMRCGRIKMQGSSGVDHRTLERNGNNVHFGAEFWPEPYDPAKWETTYGASTRWGRACLRHLADAVIETEAALKSIAAQEGGAL